MPIPSTLHLSPPPDSNWWPPEYKTGALPTELGGQSTLLKKKCKTLVESTGIEPVILMCKTSVFPLALRPLGQSGEIWTHGLEYPKLAVYPWHYRLIHRNLRKVRDSNSCDCYIIRYSKPARLTTPPTFHFSIIYYRLCLFTSFLFFVCREKIWVFYETRTRIMHGTTSRWITNYPKNTIFARKNRLPS